MPTFDLTPITNETTVKVDSIKVFQEYKDAVIYDLFVQFGEAEDAFYFMKILYYPNDIIDEFLVKLDDCDFGAVRYSRPYKMQFDEKCAAMMHMGLPDGHAPLWGTFAPEIANTIINTIKKFKED